MSSPCCVFLWLALIEADNDLHAALSQQYRFKDCPYLKAAVPIFRLECVAKTFRLLKYIAPSEPRQVSYTATWVKGWMQQPNAACSMQLLHTSITCNISSNSHVVHAIGMYVGYGRP